MLIEAFKIAVLLILPVVLIQLGLIPVKYRMWLLGLVTIAAVLFVQIEDLSLIELGIRVDNLAEAFWPYVIFTAAGVATISLTAQELGRKPTGEWRKDPHFLGLFIPISVAQVFLYRSFLMPLLHEVWPHRWFVIIGHAVLFTYLHIIYPDPKHNLPLALLGGLGFGAMYYFYPNFYLAALSHMALNFAAVYYGFFTSNKASSKYI